MIGSTSLRLPSGFDVTVAGSRGSVDGADEDTTAAFAKLSYIADLTALGEARVSLDSFRGRTNGDYAAPDGELPTARLVGLFAVQELRDLDTEVHAGVRRYALAEVFSGGSPGDVDDLTAIGAGARRRFGDWAGGGCGPPTSLTKLSGPVHPIPRFARCGANGCPGRSTTCSTLPSSPHPSPHPRPAPPSPPRSRGWWRRAG